MPEKQPSARPFWGEVPVRALNGEVYVNGQPVTPEQLSQQQVRLENAGAHAASLAINQVAENFRNR